MTAIDKITQDQLRAEPFVFEIGSTVRVHVRIKEGSRERIQVYEGVVIAKKHGGGKRDGYYQARGFRPWGMERVFPVNSPFIEKVELVRRGKVRRAKLYYLRDRVGKAAKVKERI